MTEEEMDARLDELLDDLRTLPTEEARRERIRYAIECAYDQRQRRLAEKQPVRTSPRPPRLLG
jgi:hypothetical protein